MRFKKWVSLTATSTTHIERRIPLVEAAHSLGLALVHPEWFESLDDEDRMKRQSARLCIRNWMLNLTAKHVVNGGLVNPVHTVRRPRVAEDRVLVCYQLRKGADIEFTRESVLAQRRLMTL